MKPAPFEYYAPTTVEEALSLLAEHGYDAKVLAGGQSLIPMMNFRLVQPSVLVDLNNIPELAFIRSDENGGLRLGAMTRHHQVEIDPLVAERVPLLHETMPKIAYSQIRSRGTFGGSVSHADPSAELASVSVALGGRFRLQSQSGERWVPANEFFLGLFSTVLEPGELLVEAALPSMPAIVTLDANGLCDQARLVFLSAGDVPMVAHKAAELLKGQAISSEAIIASADVAASEDIDPGSDIHATAEFRRHLANVLGRRALEQAFQRAAENK
jgi:carbon-monoxide dehydrogenase medium subunit